MEKINSKSTSRKTAEHKMILEEGQGGKTSANMNDFQEEGINIEGWKLFEIPIEGNYCFLHRDSGDSIAFANYFEGSSKFAPTYVDNKSNENKASYIREAIFLERKFHEC